MKNRFANINNLGFVVLILVVMGCSCPMLSQLAKQNNTSSSTPAPFSTPKPSSTTLIKKGEYDVTMAKYEQIRTGASRSEVESILGGKGTEVSSTTGGGVRFTVNKWEGDNYASIILTFRNDKVSTRAQVALK